MAHAYTPGLKVLRQATVARRRILPIKGEVAVARGEIVSGGQIVASAHLPGNVQMVNVASLLNVEPADVPECVKYSSGATIGKGDTLAETPGMFGMFKSRVVCPVGGTVETISAVTGQVAIREAPIPVEIDAYISGTVQDILLSEGVVITATAALVQGIFGIGGERRGKVALLSCGPDRPIDPGMILDEHRGSIVVGGCHCPLEAFQRAGKVGVAAVVSGGFNYADLRSVLGYSLGVAITGSEEIPTTLVVTEGFGSIPMARLTFMLLQAHQGEVASVNGATQIRAGVIRPEIVIPRPDLAHTAAPVEAGTGMTVGSTVRIIRAPFFGKIGTVEDLPVTLENLESETLVRVARVRLDEAGGSFLLPRANLELAGEG